jgi:hypothetical protein
VGEVSQGCGVGQCGLASPAETIQRGFGGLGRWPPIKQLRPQRARGFGVLFLREPPASVRQPAREKPARATGRQPPCVGLCASAGAVAEPAGEQNKRQRPGWPWPRFFTGAAGRTERAAVRKSEERKKHDRLSPRLWPVRWPDRGAEALFYSLKKNKQSIKMC